MAIAGPSGTVEVWLDNSLVSDLSTTVDTGTSPVGAFQIGETQTGRTYDVAFDDAAFGTSRLGPAADTTSPSVPMNVTADSTTPFSVSIGWEAASDDVGVTGYDVFRNGALLARSTRSRRSRTRPFSRRPPTRTRCGPVTAAGTSRT